MREGVSNGQIAERLQISERTAKFHVSEILSKLGLKSREEINDWFMTKPDTQRRWAKLAISIGLGAAALACLVALAVLAVATVSTTEKTTALQIEPGDVIHYTTKTSGINLGNPEQTVESWILVGEDFNTDKARVFAYNEAGRVTQDGWTDADLGLTSNNGRSFARPQFQSVFMWTDQSTIGEDLLRSGKGPNTTLAPDERPFHFAGRSEIAGVTVQVYENVFDLDADPEYPFERDGRLVRRVFLSDEPFGLDFGEETYYVDGNGTEYPVLDRDWLTFEVIDLEHTPPNVFQFQ